jgi:hypothetical protein
MLLNTNIHTHEIITNRTAQQSFHMGDKVHVKVRQACGVTGEKAKF